MATYNVKIVTNGGGNQETVQIPASDYNAAMQAGNNYAKMMYGNVGRAVAATRIEESHN